MPPQLLVSVRNAHEAAIVARHQVAIVDVKEPARGALGRPDNRTVVAIESEIDKNQQLSVALGELADYFMSEMTVQADSRSRSADPVINFPATARESFAKFGTAGLRNCKDWPEWLRAAIDLLPVSVQPVVVAYADHDQCDAPDPERVIAVAEITGCRAVLFDTCHKHRIETNTLGGPDRGQSKVAGSNRPANLFDWISCTRLAALVDKCHAQDFPVAIAGSLGSSDLESAINTGADFVGVRGAVCKSGRESLDELRLQACVQVFTRLTASAIYPLIDNDH